MVRSKQAIVPRRVVVTGLGVVSPVGIGMDKAWDNLINGRSGICRIKSIEEKHQSGSKIAGQVHDFDPLQFINPKQAKRMDRFVQLAVAASALAKEDAKLVDYDPARTGVVIGSAAGGFRSVESHVDALLTKGPDRCSPLAVPMSIANMAAGWVSILNNARGPVFCTVTACATSSTAIGDAYRLIERNEADVIFAGGTEAPITALCMSAFASTRTLSTHNAEPEKASRPFDQNRDGFVLAEGSVVLVLESLEHATKRNAYIYAELIGYAQTADAYDMVAPRAEGQGAATAMILALADAGAKPSEIGYLNAHATATMIGDRAETAAIKHVFGEHAYTLPISSTKSMHGHMMGATGAMEAAICCMALKTGSLPPTINLETPDLQCDLDYIPNRARENVPIQIAMSNSFGFGGHNACLVFEKHQTLTSDN